MTRDMDPLPLLELRERLRMCEDDVMTGAELMEPPAVDLSCRGMDDMPVTTPSMERWPDDADDELLYLRRARESSSWAETGEERCWNDDEPDDEFF